MSRRPWLSVIGFALASVVLAGCGSARPAAPDTAPQPAPAADTFPMTITHARGTTVIPAKPRRIVSIDAGKLIDTTLYLNAPLVGASQVGGRWGAAFVDRIGSVTPIGQRPNFDFEKIAALHPDLIIGLPAEFDQNYAKFAAIAPTVAIDSPPTTADAPPDWEWFLQHVAQVEGESAQVPAKLAQMRAAAEPLRSRLRGWPVAIVQSIPKASKINLCYYSPGVLFSYLGAAVNDATRANDCTPQNPESLSRITQDNIVVLDVQNDPQGELAYLRAQPLWATLPAVRAGHVYLVPGYWADGSALAYFATLQDIPRLLTDLPPG